MLKEDLLDEISSLSGDVARCGGGAGFAVDSIGSLEVVGMASAVLLA